MSTEQGKDELTYEVVMNEEEQYSVWPADKALPYGWRKAGKTGTREACLDYIKTAWTDMRPLSLRKQMESASR